MESKKSSKSLVLSVTRGFAYVAGWQCLAFIMLLLLVWVNETLDMSSLLFGLARAEPDITRGCLLSAGVFIGAIVIVGNTYLQQKRIISGLLTICSYCHKIRIDEQTWQRIEDYMSKYSPVLFTHGVCPECYDEVTREWEMNPIEGDDSSRSGSDQ